LKKGHYVAQPTNRRGTLEYNNTDLLVRTGRWQVLGGKTGYTDIARYCLVVAARIGEREVAMAFLGAEGKLTRFGDFGRAADWLLAHQDLKAHPAVPATATAAATPPAAPAAPATQAASPASAGAPPAPATHAKP